MSELSADYVREWPSHEEWLARGPFLDQGQWEAKHARLSDFASPEEVDGMIAHIKQTRSQLLRAIKALQNNEVPLAHYEGGFHPALEILRQRKAEAWDAHVQEAVARHQTDEAWERERRRRDVIDHRRHIDGEVS